MSGSPMATIAVGVIVERAKAASQWIDYIWRPTTVLAGQPDTPPWTALTDDGERTTFYAGPATVELHRSETANYRDNLATGSPSLWVVLSETGAEPPYALYLVTADPAEGDRRDVLNARRPRQRAVAPWGILRSVGGVTAAAVRDQQLVVPL